MFMYKEEISDQSVNSAQTTYFPIGKLGGLQGNDNV